MAQHDFNIANQLFPPTRADLNNALVALATTSSGTAEPTTTYANQLFFQLDVAGIEHTLKLRNDTNTGWVTIGYFYPADDSWTSTTNAIQYLTAAGIVVKDETGNIVLDLKPASLLDAQDGTNNTKVMTPLRVKQAIEAFTTGIGDPEITVLSDTVTVSFDGSTNDAFYIELLSGTPTEFTITGTFAENFFRTFYLIIKNAIVKSYSFTNNVSFDVDPTTTKNTHLLEISTFDQGQTFVAKVFEFDVQTPSGAGYGPLNTMQFTTSQASKIAYNSLYTTDNGEYVYYYSTGTDGVAVYPLATPFDLTTIGSTATGTDDWTSTPVGISGFMGGFFWGNNGSKAYMLDVNGALHNLKEFNTSLAYQAAPDTTYLTAANAVDLFSLFTPLTNEQGRSPSISVDGTKIAFPTYVNNTTTTRMHAFSLSIPFDLSSISYIGVIDTTGVTNGLTSRVSVTAFASHFGPLGETYYVFYGSTLNPREYYVVGYDLSTPYDVTTAVYNGDFVDVTSIVGSPFDPSADILLYCSMQNNNNALELITMDSTSPYTDYRFTVPAP
jgi:hypothetical protein